MTTATPPVGTIGVTPTFGNNFDRFIARGIQFATATRKPYRGYADAPVNHAVVFVGNVPGRGNGPQLVQAQPGGADFAPWDSYGDSMYWLTHMGQEVPAGAGIGGTKIGPLLEPTENQRQVIKAFAVDAAVKKIGYNYLDFVAIAMAQNRFQIGTGEAAWLDDEWWVKRLSNDNRLICSQLADAAWHAAGLDIFADGRPAGLVSPEDLYLAGGAPTHGE